ncbi:MAG TPA: hypothetical protein VJN93_11070 [Candidatus Acidoferrum sp.]|nr:hypothetical protein [Candidatus Acidoferrum sp.]
MKFALSIFALTLLLPPSTPAQSSSARPAAAGQNAARPSRQPSPNPFAGAPAASPADVISIDHILRSLYDVISGPPGERDWNRFRSLFLPSAHLTSTSIAPDGSVRVHPVTVNEYASLAGSYFLNNGFFESPIVNRVQSFGNITQVFSSYESRHARADAPFARGINSIQLLYDGKRWWIVSILWDEERPGNSLPADMATKP